MHESIKVGQRQGPSDEDDVVGVTWPGLCLKLGTGEVGLWDWNFVGLWKIYKDSSLVGDGFYSMEDEIVGGVIAVS